MLTQFTVYYVYIYSDYVCISSMFVYVFTRAGEENGSGVARVGGGEATQGGRLSLRSFFSMLTQFAV